MRNILAAALLMKLFKYTFVGSHFSPKKHCPLTTEERTHYVGITNYY